MAKGSAAFGKRLGAPGLATARVVILPTTWLLWSDGQRRTIGKILSPVLEQFAAHEDKQQQPLAALELVMFQPINDPTPMQMVAAVLARASKPLLPAEVHEELRDWPDPDS